MKMLAAIPAQADAREFHAYARSLMLSRGHGVMVALAEAEATPGVSARVVSVLKAAVAAGTTTSPTWAGELVEYTIIANGFMESLRQASAFDAMLPSMRKVPIGHGRIVANTTVLVASVVGEGKPKPVSQLSLAGTDMAPQKVAAIVVLSTELVKSPGATGFIGAELRGAVASGSDVAFVAGAAAVAIPISGSADPGADLALMLAAVGAGANSALYLLMSPSMAGQMAVKTGPNGFLYPGMTPTGGEVAGIPALATAALENDEVLLIDASRVAADGGSIVLDTAQHANLDMNDAPVAGTAATVSLWQNNLLGLRAERWLSFVLAASAAALATGCSWGAPA